MQFYTFSKHSLLNLSICIVSNFPGLKSIILILIAYFTVVYSKQVWRANKKDLESTEL